MPKGVGYGQMTKKSKPKNVGGSPKAAPTPVKRASKKPGAKGVKTPDSGPRTGY